VHVVDTNVLLYAADRASPFHEVCRTWLEHRRSQPERWYLTWGTLYEFLRVATHPRVLRTPSTSGAAWQFVEQLPASRSAAVLVETDRHHEVAGRVPAEMPYLAGNLLHDAHTVILMREHGVRAIVTRDADFHRFRGVAVMDPVAL